MSVLTKMKNREIAQRASTGDTTAPVDCFEIDEHFSSTLDGSWRTKIDDTSLWVSFFQWATFPGHQTTPLPLLNPTPSAPTPP